MKVLVFKLNLKNLFLWKISVKLRYVILIGATVSTPAPVYSAASMQNQYYPPSGYNNAGSSFGTSMTHKNPVLQKVNVVNNTVIFFSVRTPNTAKNEPYLRSTIIF